MLLTPSVSMRTVIPATMVANHMKVLKRENAGRSSWIAFHHKPHSDSDRPRFNMARSMVALVRYPCYGPEIHNSLTMTVLMIGSCANGDSGGKSQPANASSPRRQLNAAVA